MGILAKDYFDLASLAEASYADFSSFSEAKDALLASGFSDSQADDIVSRWSVKAHLPNTSTGFSMSLFEGVDGFVLAFRGTEPTNQWASDIRADVGDIVADGIALDQIIDLVNFWAWVKSDGVYTAAKLEVLTDETLALQTVNYLGDKASRAIFLASMALRDDVVIDFPSNTVRRVVWENSDTAFDDPKYQGGLGLGDDIAAKGLTVTGHSLGGHLASAFTRLFPESNADALTVNGAGFGIVGLSGFASKNVSNVFEMLFGHPSFDSETILNLYGDKNPEFVTQDVLLKQPGGHLPIFIEQASFIDHTLGHGTKPITDTLAVYDLFFKMDKKVSLGNLLKIFNGASNTSENSLESMVDFLAKLFKVDVSLVLDDRESLHKSINFIRESSYFINVAGSVSVSAAVNSHLAKSDFGHFLSLYFSTPFVLLGAESTLLGLHGEIYTLWSADKSLSAADRQNGKANFSDEWYQDRTNYLSLLLERNAKDIDYSESANPSADDVFYSDSGGSGWVFSGGVNAGSINQDPAAPRVVFGTNESNTPANSGPDGFVGGNGNDRIYGLGGNDKLSGLKGNDQLYAGIGDDELTGGEGHDVLHGGSGNDTYIFEGNFGTDVIKDSDGSGTISIAGWSGSFTSVQGSDIIFRDESQKFEAIKINNGSSTDLLITSLTDETTGNVLIKNWNPGNLGISLTVEASTPSNGSAGTVNGDGGNNAITLDNLRDSNPNLDISTFSALYADGGGGNDIIMGMLQGNDTLLGGAGDDIISGGFTTTLGADASKTFQSVAAVPGADSIDGGAGKDFIFASAGGSIAHGGSDNDILVSTGPAYFQFNNLKAVLADESRGITGHRAITRDEIYTDAITRMNFGVTKNGLNYQLSNSYFNGFTSSYAEYNSAIENVKFIGKSGSTASNHSNGDVSYGFAGSYTLTYDYSNNGVLTPLSTGNPSPASMAISTFAPGAGKTLDDFANVKGANLFGDAGDDYLSGGIYADYLSGGTDKDTVFAGAGNDIVDGGDGNDELHGGEGRDIIIGGKGDDTLVGDGGNDLLVGGEGKDGFIGGDGDDILVGGVEDQYMSGGAGNNIYIFEDIVYEEADLRAAASNANANSLGYAPLSSQTSAQASSSSAPLLTIESTEGNSTLALVGVSSLDQISLTAQENDLILRTGNAAIFIRDGLSGAVDHLALGNSADEFKDSATSAKSTTIDEVMLARLTTEVTRTAQAAGTQLAGGLANDTLTAHAGGSILIGGQSDDTLLGNVGDDIYVIRAGDGFDSITEQGGTNTIKLSEGITADQLALRRTNGNLLLILSSGQSVVVNGMFDVSTGDLVASKAIHKIEFSDGEFWDLTRLLQESAKGVALTGGDHNDLLIGYESSDTLTGGKGNDKLRGDKGDDHYHFAIGDGADQIDDSHGSDHIYFAEGINETHVSLRKDTSNNLIIRINNNDSITVLNAFNATGELTPQAIEHIHFNNTSVWDLARIQTELAKNQSHIFTGTIGNDQLVGDNAIQVFNGGKGEDRLSGGNASDVYQYALGDGKDVVKDINGIDRLELLAGINENEVVARRSGDDLVLTMKDGGSVTIQNTFGVKAANVVDPVITTLIEQLQSHWISQAEKLIEQHYGLSGSGDITLGFEDGLDGAEAAHVEAIYLEPNGTGTDLKLVIDLSDFSNIPNGTAPLYLDRIIAHEMVHAVMARNMNNTQLPGWFTEGTAEFIHGADERVKGDANIIGLESNFIQLFKTTAGSPSTSAGYSVSYIAVKLLDKEIRNHGGVGIKEVFDQLKTGKTLDQSLMAVSATYSGLAAVWSNLSTFETHFKAVGFSQYTHLLTLDNLDTGSIAGSDYGNSSLSASAVMPEALTGPSKNFNLVIPEQYVATPEIRGLLETIGFNSGAQWDQARINQEVLKPTNGDDVIHAFDTNDLLSGAKGNDQLFGYGGNDIYRYALGDGNDVIVDSAGTDQIELSADILEQDVSVARDTQNNLVITLKDYSSLIVKGAFDASDNPSMGAVEAIKFLSGGVWDSEKIKEETNKIDASIIRGTVSPDTLIGTDDKDILIGGKGNDLLFGGEEIDSYMFNVGDGHDTIEDGSSNINEFNKIVLGSGINRGNIVFGRTKIDLVMMTNEHNDQITFSEFFTSDDYNRQTYVVHFTDTNETIDLITLLKNSNTKVLTPTEGSNHISGFDRDDYIEGLGGNDYLYGNSGNDTINGGAGRDRLYGEVGDDTLNGGLGDDEIYGGGGINSYLFYKGDGSDYINAFINNESTHSLGGRIVFGENVSHGDISFSISNASVSVHYGTGDVVVIGVPTLARDGWVVTREEEINALAGWDLVIEGETTSLNDLIDGATNIVSNIGRYLFGPRIQLYFGTSWNDIINVELDSARAVNLKGGFGNDNLVGSQFYDGLYGESGNDTLNGSLGNDTLDGGEGNDTYIYNYGAGNDEITESSGIDSVQFGSGILSHEIVVARSNSSINSTDAKGADLLFTFSSGESLKIKNVFIQDSAAINAAGIVEEFQFSNNTHWTFDQVLKLIAGGDLYAPLQPSASFDSSGSVIHGLAEAGSFVEVKNRAGILLGSTTANATTGSYSINLPIALVNNEIVHVTATDVPGNVSAVNVINAPDYTAPAEPHGVFFPDPGKYISGVAEIGSYVEVRSTTGELLERSEVITSADGAYSITFAVKFINGEVVNLRAIDAAGNISIAKTLTAPDLTAPLVPTASFDASGKVIAGVAEAGSMVVVKNSNNTSTLGTVTADATTGAYSITLATALINKENVNVTAKDITGNISAIKAIIAPDKTAPAAPTATLDAVAKIVSGVAEAGSSVTVKDSEGQTLGVVQANATTGAYSVSFTQTLTNGQSLFTTATDTAGNVSAVTATPIVINTGPSPVGNGLRGSYYGYHQPSNGNVNLTNVAQVLGFIANKTPDATFVATNFQYGAVAGANDLGMGNTLQKFLKTDATSLNVDPASTSDAILRFDGKIQLNAGSYNFRVNADDGYSIRVNGAVVAEYNANGAAVTRTHAAFTIAQSGLQDIEIVYWDSAGGNALNVELANTATGTYSYLNENILVQPAIVQSARLAAVMEFATEPNYDGIHYFNRNAALVQAMASFVSESGVDARYRATYVEQSPLMIAVGS